MKRSSVLATIAIGMLAATALAQNVTVTLTSSADGQLVRPGAAVDWQVEFSVSAADNAGLALLVCDLVQDPNNASFFDVAPADGVPSGMSNFSRPDGVSNPGETDPVTGYIGVQRGTPGAMNLIQIGGGQNNTGEALPPGTGVGENANVVSGVGQSGPQLLASGSFTAPEGDCGSYTLRLADVVANVFEQISPPPAFSPAMAAAVDASGARFGFTVALAGDLDLDGDVDLSDLAQLLAHFDTPSGANPEDGDIDGDGDVDLSDLAALLPNFDQSC